MGCHIGMGRLADGVRNPSVIYANYVDGSISNVSSVSDPDEIVSSWLKNSGIKRIITGHQPVGDAPIVAEAFNGIQVISFDAKYF